MGGQTGRGKGRDDGSEDQQRIVCRVYRVEIRNKSLLVTLVSGCVHNLGINGSLCGCLGVCCMDDAWRLWTGWFLFA